ncbi:MULTISPECIES: EthD family reductase [unclassified Arthrobacter]|uniref:EthD family reductase n=1 Tax=unclassified Arthrobacter TaxID=235627 RepID=UPI001D146ABB|nr:MULTISPECIES: EthD family reductase [unclassified Arthrobacter]MCC3274514.1 EthD family reductase [Arthrobacter sp. zg-Y20]MCC3279495.1 EthD family reductase [Arthrobacter sp. zg-Y40]MCC9177895.1 EthD family reductase [Arthrobacter sp. zg-Y750]MDK1314671.1 EthD family reductase [Arthrobacter sp. zg.Y20]MDK1327554.1 EthD family reductase [Arthrobacter sp. zg-Y1143]
MPTKITFIIDNPADPGAFESAYKSIEGNAKQLPKLRRYEAGKVWPKEDGSPTPAHRTLDLYFDSYEDASAAVKTAAAADTFGQLTATGTPFRALFSDVSEG